MSSMSLHIVIHGTVWDVRSVNKRAARFSGLLGDVSSKVYCQHGNFKGIEALLIKELWEKIKYKSLRNLLKNWERRKGKKEEGKEGRNNKKNKEMSHSVL